MLSSESIVKRPADLIAEIKKENESTKACIYASWIIATIFTIGTAIPLLVLSNASLYSDMIKYHGITQYTCLGGANLTNPQITPYIYNTSLTYWPAQLHASTFVMYHPGKYHPVTLSYPTLFEKKFDCEPSKYRNQHPCEKFVGDVITKYEQLRAMETFTCYVEGDTIIGLGGEFNDIIQKYRCSTAGIVIMVFYAIVCIVHLGVQRELICYIKPIKAKSNWQLINNNDTV